MNEITYTDYNSNNKIMRSIIIEEKIRESLNTAMFKQMSGGPMFFARKMTTGN